MDLDVYKHFHVKYIVKCYVYVCMCTATKCNDYETFIHPNNILIYSSYHHILVSLI